MRFILVALALISASTLAFFLLRPTPPVDRDHDGTPDVEQMLVEAPDGYTYFYKGNMDFNPIGARLVCLGKWVEMPLADEVDAEWVRIKVPKGGYCNLSSYTGHDWFDLTKVKNRHVLEPDNGSRVIAQ